MWLYPSNNNSVITDNSYHFTYCNLLLKAPFTNFPFPKDVNNIEILVKNFDICNLYKTMLLGEYVRIKDNVLYWRNEEMPLQKTK